VVNSSVSNHRVSARARIVTIVQELAIVPGLTVAEKSISVSRQTTAGFVRAVSLDVVFASSRRRGFDLSPDRRRRPIDRRPTKSGNHASALSQRFNLVMDEPTAALSETRPPPSTRSSVPGA